MSTNLTKAELVRSIAEGTGLPLKAVGDVLDMLGDAIRVSTANGMTVLTGFGRFAPKIRPARMGRNPRTGEAVEVRERRTVSFKPGKSIS